MGQQPRQAGMGHPRFRREGSHLTQGRTSSRTIRTNFTDNTLWPTSIIYVSANVIVKSQQEDEKFAKFIHCVIWFGGGYN